MPKQQTHSWLIDFGVPLVLFLLYLQFYNFGGDKISSFAYNFGKITPPEMVKTTGLLAIALLSLTLIIGPICRFFPSLDFLKAHRKSWGIISFAAALIHTILIFIYYFKLDLSKFVDPTNPKYLGILAGLLAITILAIVTLTSNKKVLTSINPKTWKLIQTTSYLALILAIAHFYIVESTNGVLVIKRLLGQVTFGFAGLVVLFRFLIMIFPSSSKPQ